ncbi:hypothetical protein N8E89_23775 (plasmid) [Phyllobacterium sp. A18/5-2]|uniref:hypothetical protein n=1 Tax=Phyllobacterium sp. A18/5-2 TaxID=2978392 RepID=UPI0021C9313F|nr:hypothetical protein [Phyllobacterium sp. A18/5-2]UXN66209.1 hypothetical protein N8E89_23775 [Phyllobacterium sp. A18/5-2]
MTDTSEFQPDEVRRSVHQTLVHNYIDWGMVRAHIVKRTGLARQETRIARDQHSFLINLKGGARSGEDFVEGRSVGFTPAVRALSFLYLLTVNGVDGTRETPSVHIYSYP